MVTCCVFRDTIAIIGSPAGRDTAAALERGAARCFPAATSPISAATIAVAASVTIAFRLRGISVMARPTINEFTFERSGSDPCPLAGSILDYRELSWLTLARVDDRGAFHIVQPNPHDFLAIMAD